MDNYEEWKSLSPLLKTTYKKLKAEWYKGIDANFSMSQIRMMQILDNNSPMKSTDMAEMLCITAGAITLSADKLCERGLVNRYRSDTDRRVVYLEIMDKGREYLASFRSNDEHLIKYVSERITIDDLKELKRIVTLIGGSLEGD